jgi:hypothetical protein
MNTRIILVFALLNLVCCQQDKRTVRATSHPSVQTSATTFGKARETIDTNIDKVYGKNGTVGKTSPKQRLEVSSATNSNIRTAMGVASGMLLFMLK